MRHLLWVPAVSLLITAGTSAQMTELAMPMQASMLAPAEAELPDSPGTVALGAAMDFAPDSAPGSAQDSSQDAGQGDSAKRRRKQHPPPCVPIASLRPEAPEAMSAELVRQPCAQNVDPFQPFLNSSTPVALTTRQKAHLAVHDIIDPFNVMTIVANSAFTIGIDAHTAYGPGMRGFGRNVGISFVEDATGEVIGTFGVCSLFHQDPHYYRMPNARPWRRIGHVLAHVVVAQNDDGRTMINYEDLITYPASAEISNLYVPGIHGNGPSTVERIVTGLATEPVGNFIAEFLPDLARRIHIRIVIVQQLLNQIASGQTL